MGYQEYGISKTLVDKVRKRMKNPLIKERVKALSEGITRADLQNREAILRLLHKGSGIVGVKIDGNQTENIVRFVLSQKIDPKNTFHLIKLWGMFR